MFTYMTKKTLLPSELDREGLDSFPVYIVCNGKCCKLLTLCLSS